MSMLELGVQCSCPKSFHLLGGLFGKHAVRLVLRTVTNMLNDILAHGLHVAAYVRNNLRVALSFITVQGILAGSDESFGPNGRRWFVVSFSFSGLHFVALPHPPLPPNIHNHGSLLFNQETQLCRLPAGAKLNSYRGSDLGGIPSWPKK